MSRQWELEQQPASPRNRAAGRSPGGGGSKPEQLAAEVAKRKNEGGLDPYLRWAVATDWRGFALHAGWPPTMASWDSLKPPIQIQVLAEQRTPEPPPKGLEVAKVYEGRTFFAGRANWDALLALVRKAHGLRWELAMPLRDAEGASRASPHGYFPQERDRAAFRAANQLPQIAPSRPPSGLKNVIALIDFGCPFLNERFASGDGSKSRIVALWDQGSEATAPKDEHGHDKPWPWRPQMEFGYGRELGQDTLQQAFQQVRTTSLDETAVYRGWDYLINYDDPRRRVWFATHGSHVMDLACGRHDPLTGQADLASDADLVFVQLPSLTAADSSGGSLGAHLLDAVRYVLRLCAADAKVVINVSYGTQAGPHEGESTFERALDELLLQERKTNCAVVFAAGNSRQAACHVKREVNPGFGALLRAELPPGDTTDTCIESWYRPRAKAPLEVRVRSPEMNWSRWVGANDQVLLFDQASQDVVAMLRHDVDVPNSRGADGGDGKALVLLAVAPTAAPDGWAGELAPAGGWRIEFRRSLPRAQDDGLPMAIESWIERDDPGRGSDRPRAAFVGPDREDDRHSLNGIATGRHVLVAGGFRLSDGQPCGFSSLGPVVADWAKQGLPAVLAAAEEDDEQADLRAAAVRSSEVFRMNGTSVAAPVLARRLYNQLAKSKKPIPLAHWPALLKELAGSDDPYLRLTPDPSLDPE